MLFVTYAAGPFSPSSIIIVPQWGLFLHVRLVCRARLVPCIYDIPEITLDAIKMGEGYQNSWLGEKRRKAEYPVFEYPKGVRIF